MKKILFAFAMMLATAGCANYPTTTVDDTAVSNEVNFEVARNYFLRNDQTISETHKITTQEEFEKLFGMATTMGENGKPTPIDFNRQFVLTIVQPVTDTATEITPVKVEDKGDSLLYTFKVKAGEKLSFSIQPISIIILDKKYEDKEIVFDSEQ